MLELAETFRRFSATCQPRAPLYADLADFVADEPELLALMNDVPTTQRIPVLLFASVHYLLLADRSSNLANFYPNISQVVQPRSPRAAFKSYALDHASELQSVMATHSTQTNEVGRCAQFIAPMIMLNQELSQSANGLLAHIDVGTSAGLNLLLGHYSYEFTTGKSIGPSSSVVIRCETRGAFPQLNSLPDVAWSIGLDPSPIDVRDSAQTRWLEACVWPDQQDRFERLVAAIDIARSAPPNIVVGDAVGTIASLIDQALEYGHPTITTSWVMNYLSPDDRRAFVGELDRIGTSNDLSWIIAESPDQTSGLPVFADSTEDITVLSLITWRGGRRTSRRLARTHPHGYWIHWGE